MTTGTSNPGALRVLLYSDDSDTRASVRLAVGDVGPAGRAIEWVETATHAMVEELSEKERFDLLILDGEADKAGGMGVCRQLKNQVFECPPVLVLVARAADAWLATWSQADAIAEMPVDPFTFPELVFDLLGAKVA